VRGNGTTLVSICVPGGQAIAITAQKISAELATGERIKSKDTRHAVCAALRSLKARLAQYREHHAPPNGLALFASDELCELLDALPAPLRSPLYRCDATFHLQPLEAMINEGPSWGFIVFDGSGCVIATVTNNHVHKLGSLVAHLPKKHGKGGQSAPRFQHTRLEQRIIFRKRVEALARQVLISPSDHKPICKGIVIAGSSTFKNELELDVRLAPIVLATVTVQYSGMNGLHEAIERSRDVLGGVALYEEVDLLRSFFERLDTDQPACFGERATVQALLGSAVETLILTEDRSELHLCTMPDGTHRLLLPGDPRMQQEATESTPVAELARVKTVCGDSREGAQFCAGFGIGALLRYRLIEVDLDGCDQDGVSDQDEDEFV
jgi:peptide chain release factor subunit 1